MTIKCKKVRAKKLNKSTVRFLWILMIVSLVISLIAELFLGEQGHHFKVEKIPFFYAVFGFVSCVAIIVISKYLGLILKRKENYYEKD